MLKLVGLGLSWKDISMNGLEAVKKADEVYLESYTSLSNFSVSDLEDFIGRKIISLNRLDVEENQPYLANAKNNDIVLLVYGDPLSATTHFEILSEAKSKGIKTQIIHATSIFTAVATTGLSLYKFGKVASIPFKHEGFAPTSFYDILKNNLSIDAHTIFLLDLEPKTGKFLSVPMAIEYLIEVDKTAKERLISDKTLFIGCARLGTNTQTIKVGTALQLKKFNFGTAPYCLILPAKLNFKEKEYLDGKICLGET